MIILSGDQHHFFQQLAEIAFTNPFSSECETKECRLIGSREETMEPKVREIEIQKTARYWLNQCERFNIRHFSDKDREIMEISWLFHTYRDIQDDFDKFIATQSTKGDSPVVLPFSQHLISLFGSAGFDREETAKYIALFYQLRRGFNFISKAISGDSQCIVNLRMRLWNNIFTFNPNWYLRYL